MHTGTKFVINVLRSNYGNWSCHVSCQTAQLLCDTVENINVEDWIGSILRYSCTQFDNWCDKIRYVTYDKISVLTQSTAPNPEWKSSDIYASLEFDLYHHCFVCWKLFWSYHLCFRSDLSRYSFRHWQIDIWNYTTCFWMMWLANYVTIGLFCDLSIGLLK